MLTKQVVDVNMYRNILSRQRRPPNMPTNKEIEMLNGWQRIWIVLGVLFMLFPGLPLINEIPTEDDIYRSWANESIKLTLTIKEFKKLSLVNIRDLYKDITDQEIISKVQGKFSDSTQGYNLDFSSINKEYESRMDDLLYSQVLSIARYLGIWLVVMIAIYIFGWSIGWIIRGFHTNNA